MVVVEEDPDVVEVLAPGAAEVSFFFGLLLLVAAAGDLSAPSISPPAGENGEPRVRSGGKNIFTDVVQR